jgi:hypothetical protein
VTLSPPIPRWRWERDKSEMLTSIPITTWNHSSPYFQYGHWQVPVEPLLDDLDESRVIEDLDKNNYVWVSANGKLRHGPLCVLSHTPHEKPLLLPDHASKYVANVGYPGPLSHPRAWVTHAGWTSSAIKSHPNIFPDGGSCPMFPAADTWRLRRDSVVAYIDQVLLWIVKPEIWLGRGAKKNGVGWPGSQQPHDQ